MRIKEKRKSPLTKVFEFLEAFTAVDYPDEKEVNIAESQEPNMKELKESLNRVDDLERKFYVSSSSNPKGGKGNGNKNIVEKVNVDNKEAIRQANENAKNEVEKQQEQQVEK